jgi:flagella basal body P-ring formation protein FlgA
MTAMPSYMHTSSRSPGAGSVGILTRRTLRRRTTDAVFPIRLAARRILTGAIVLASVLAAPAAMTARIADRQAVESIEKAAEAFVMARAGGDDSRLSLRAGPLDPRLDLPRCSEALEGFLRKGTEIRSRTVVGVRCAGDAPWKVYVPVDVIVTDDVLVAARTLPGGQVPGPGDVRVEKRDVSRLVGGYLSTPDELAGQRLKSQLHAGRIITPAMLQADEVIRRGQTVTLLVKDEGVTIRMAGKALMKGALNQRIRVENSGSKRVVEGLVRSPEHVEVLVY